MTMTLRPRFGMAATVLVVATASAAWAWRDCMLLAVSAVLAYRLFLVSMDRGAPWRALAAAVNSLFAGVLASGAGIGLLAGVVAAWLGWWHPTPDHAAPTLVFLAAGAAGCCLARDSEQAATEELRLWLCMLAGVLLAAQARQDGMSLAPCLFVVGVGAAMLWAGWRMATDTASALLRAGTGAHPGSGR